MQIQNQTQPLDLSQLTGSTSTAPAVDPTAKLANEQTFLQLLVAQIKNQDPTNPTDSIQFVTQLAQFSQLEQLIGIRQELQTQPSSSTVAANQNNGTAAAAGTNATTETTN